MRAFSMWNRWFVLLLCATWLGAVPGTATTFVSVEPVPNVDVAGPEILTQLLSLPYDQRALWAQSLLDCNLVRGVIDALSSDGTIVSINQANTFFSVAAGGYEGWTNPTFLFTITDRGVNAARAEDVETLVNALGFVFSQGSTVHFNAEDAGAHDFPLAYVTISFASGPPDGDLAHAFFRHAGSVDEALFSGLFAGYTQVGRDLVFLIPDVDGERFVAGMYEAASTFPGVEYGPLVIGTPTTASAGVAFRGNDWLAYPEGDGYLVNVSQDPAADLDGLDNLERLRSRHLAAVWTLHQLIIQGRFAVADCRLRIPLKD